MFNFSRLMLRLRLAQYSFVMPPARSALFSHAPFALSLSPLADSYCVRSRYDRSPLPLPISWHVLLCLPIFIIDPPCTFSYALFEKALSPSFFKINCIDLMFCRPTARSIAHHSKVHHTRPAPPPATTRRHVQVHISNCFILFQLNFCRFEKK